MGNSSLHETLNVSVEDNIIFIEAEGPWNKEYLDGLHQKLLWGLKQVDPRTYATILTPKGEALTVEYIQEQHIEFIRHSQSKIVAINLDHCTTSLLAENLFSKIYRAAGFKYAFFDNVFDARLWIEKQMITADNSVS